MKKIFVLFVTGFLVFCSSAIANQNKGAEKMQLDGGSNGKVPFPHHKHQKTLGDCQKCHVMFPQQSGTIVAMKTEGRLEKKAVMNTLCIRCHRAEKKAGKPSGPVRCSECHVKER